MKNNKSEKKNVASTQKASNKNVSLPLESNTMAASAGVIGGSAAYLGLNYLLPEQNSEALTAEITNLHERLSACQSALSANTSLMNISSLCQDIILKPYEYLESLSQETCTELFSNIKNNCETLTELAVKDIHTENELSLIKSTIYEISHHLIESKKEIFSRVSQNFLDEATHQFANRFCENSNSIFSDACISIIYEIEPQLLPNAAPYLSSILSADANTIDGLRSIHAACQAIPTSFSSTHTTSVAITAIMQEAKNQFIESACSNNILLKNTCSQIVHDTVHNNSFELLENALEKLSAIQGTLPNSAENLLSIKKNCSILKELFTDKNIIQESIEKITNNATDEFAKSICSHNILTLASDACTNIIQATSDEALISTSSLLSEIGELSFSNLSEVNRAKEICRTIIASAQNEQSQIADACQDIVKAASEQFAILSCEGVSSNFTIACTDIIGNALLSDEAIYIVSTLNEIKNKVAQDVLSYADVNHIQQQCNTIVAQFNDSTVVSNLENACRIIVEEAAKKTTYSESILLGIGATATLATTYFAQPIANTASQFIQHAVVTPTVFAAGAIQSTASFIKDCSNPEHVAEYGSAVVDAAAENPWVTTALTAAALTTTAYLAYKNRGSLSSLFRKNQNTQAIEDGQIEEFRAPSPPQR